MKKLIFILFFFPQVLWALSAEQVVQSSLEHFPKVIEAVQKLEVEQNKVTEARGSFDGKIKGEVNSRTDGFYDGDAYSLSVEKPIPYFNSKVFGGRRQGVGNFPTYEGKMETLNRGEDFAGFSVSLLRNALIDQNRYNVRFTEQDREQAKININAVKINVQTMALKAYWTWFVKGHELKVYENILELATDRNNNLTKRIKAGDLAAIYASENNQYILKRQAQVAQKKMEFQEASFYLSLFYRSPTGIPVQPALGQLPNLSSEKLNVVNDTEQVFQKALGANLNLKNLASQAKQARLDIQYGTNEMLPALDLKFEWSQDRGIGPTELSQEENRVMLNLEVPLEFNKGRGKRRAGKAQLERIKTKQQWAREKVRVDSQALVTKLNSFAKIFELTTEQAQLSKKLADAERKKFSRGASDLILVNIREENLAEAQIKNLVTLLKYYFIDAELKNLQVEM